MKDIDIIFSNAGLLLLVILVVLIPNALQASAQQPQQQQPQPPQQGQQSGQQLGNFDNIIASGTIDSLLFTGPTQWIATGTWNMKIADGDIEDFLTKMTWYSSNGTAWHTHEIQNFDLDNGNELALTPGNSISLIGESDVGTNGKIIWKNVPTTININAGRTISILLDDEETDTHFARQPIYGIVYSMAPCGGAPGPNMQVFQPC